MNIQRIKILLGMPGLIILFLAMSAYAGQELTAQGLLTRCLHEGSLIDTQKLTRSEQEEWQDGWIEATDKIATGDGEWIEVVPCMIRGMYSTGSASAPMFLHVALGRALPKNPAAILALENVDVSTKRTCSFPFYEGNEEPLESYVEETLAALAELEAHEELSEDAMICASRLKKSYEIIKARGEYEE